METIPPVKPYTTQTEWENISNRNLRNTESTCKEANHEKRGMASAHLLAISMRLDRVGTHSDELIDKANELYRNERAYIMHITRQGRIMNDGLTDFGQILVQPMEPMRIDDPYALCFALLYLAEADGLYGACCGFMGEVVESLPWGIFEYDELDDDIWDGGRLIADDAALPKSVQIPDAYERNYRMKGDDFNFPRNLAQIIYEETGCVLPRNLHIYDSRAKMLGRYGIKGKDAASALMLMYPLTPGLSGMPMFYGFSPMQCLI